MLGVFSFLLVCLSPSVLPASLPPSPPPPPSLSPSEERGCCRGLGEVLELRLEQMERRLKEHMDQRLDALEVRLQKALLQALPLVTLSQPAKTSSVAPPDHIHPPQTLNGT